jgi:hypothetical protein
VKKTKFSVSNIYIFKKKNKKNERFSENILRTNLKYLNIYLSYINFIIKKYNNFEE